MYEEYKEHTIQLLDFKYVVIFILLSKVVALGYN